MDSKFIIQIMDVFYIIITVIFFSLLIWALYRLITSNWRKKKSNSKSDVTAENLLKNFNEYAFDIQRQYRVSFWFSISAASLGFVFLLYIILRRTEGDNNLETELYASMVIEAVSTLFFTISRKYHKDYKILLEKIHFSFTILQSKIFADSLTNETAKQILYIKLANASLGNEINESEIEDRYLSNKIFNKDKS